MSKTLSKYIIFIVSIGVSTSCGIYRQNMVNTPLLEEKGEAQITGYAGFTGYGAQLGSALTKKIALIANYSNTGTKRVNYSSVNYTIDKHNFLEMGTGYFRKNKAEFISEYFILAGKGTTSRYYQGLDTAQKIINTFQQVSYNRFCIQADFGKIDHKWEYAISPRLIVINYYNISDNSTDRFKNKPDTYLYTDLAGTLRYTILKHLKISGQVNLTLPVTGFNSSYFAFSPFNCSMGMNLNMNLFKADHPE